jgi:hypothetical protein
MRKLLVVSLCVVFALASLTAVATAKTVNKGLAGYQLHSPPITHGVDLPEGVSPPTLSSAVADTFHLYWAEFDAGGTCTAQGWTAHDLTAQIDCYWHAAREGSELNGGTYGSLHAAEGLQSWWCGKQVDNAIPYCGWATLPGYGNSWDQFFTSDTLVADTLHLSYLVSWDSETDWDQTFLQVADLTQSPVVWNDVAEINAGAGLYDGFQYPAIVENLVIAKEDYYGGGASTRIRWYFHSDGAWSDEDGLWNTDGAVIIDSITVTDQLGLPVITYEDAENETEGDKVTVEDDDADGVKNYECNTPPAYGDFSGLFPGIAEVQEDPCFTEFTCVWAFHNGSAFNYACGGFPAQAAVPKEDANGLYITNEVWSPPITFGGAGSEVLYQWRVYRDLPLDNLVFYVWHVRSIDATGCPGTWEDFNFVYYGGQKDWLLQNQSIGQLILPTAVEVQLALGAWDMCGYWCGKYGTGACHSHTPLLDEAHLIRINTTGPQWQVRHIELFNDHFPDDGTITGTGRADCAMDILPSTNASIRPGDTIVVTVSDPGGALLTDPGFGGAAVYCYVQLAPQPQPTKGPANMESPDLNCFSGLKRFPYIGPVAGPGGVWHQYRMDTIYTTQCSPVLDKYCFDLNDTIFTPPDTIWYFLGAQSTTGATYFSRTLDGQGGNFTTANIAEAMDSPMEFQILPGAGYFRGGDILYVDDVDDRGGPAQLYFDTSLKLLGLFPFVDRYDVLGPSSLVSNSPGGQFGPHPGHGVKNIAAQIIGDLDPIYRKIIWNSGNLSSGLIGDGTSASGLPGAGPEKADDFLVLYTFLDLSPYDPGVYISGDDIAEEWSVLIGASAVAMKSFYLNFNLVNGNHVAAGEPISPVLTGSGAVFVHGGVPDQFIAFGGCPLINDFDVLEPVAPSVSEMTYPNNPATNHASISNNPGVPNTGGSVARAVMDGFSFNYIRDILPVPPPGGPARTHHLLDIIRFLQNIVDDPTGSDPKPQFANVLRDNYPNPFNPTTTIEYSIKEAGLVSLKVYNVAGQLVRTLVNTEQKPQVNSFKVTWDGRNDAGDAVSSGVYFYKLVAKNFTQTKKMVLLK